MTIEEKIITILLQSRDVTSENGLFHIMNDISKNEIMTALNCLVSKKIIHRSRHGLGGYLLTSNASIEGKIVSVDDDYIVVSPYGDRNVFVRRSNYPNSKVGMHVLLRFIHEINEKCVGSIDKKIYSKKILVGTVQKENNAYYIKHRGGHYKINMTHVKENIENKIVQYKILKKRQYEKSYIEIMNIVGTPNTYGIENDILIARFNIPNKFDYQIKEEIDNIKVKVLKKELFGRVDYRNNLVVTIDGADTADMDDAVEVTKLENGTYRLIVHIANVSHYVKQGSKIYEQAYKRGTSYYQTDCTVPMLPNELSSGICSLMEGVERLTLSCEMIINQQGEVIEYHINRGVICSKKKMTYEKVNKALKGNPDLDYEEYQPNLFDMKELSDIIRFKMIQDGYIDFNLDETRIRAEKGMEPQIQVRERGEAEKIIENFMIIANETIAKNCKEHHMMTIYREHDYPLMKSLFKFIKGMELLGYQMDIPVPEQEELLNYYYQQVLSSSPIKDKEIVNEYLVRTMRRAKYSIEEGKHFGIGDFYLHFTSPIRRLADLIVHALLEAQIDGVTLTPMQEEKTRERLLNLALQATLKEKDAGEVATIDKQIQEVEFMKRHYDEVFLAHIIEISGNFVLLETRDLKIIGSLKLDTPEFPYYFNPIDNSIIHRNKQDRYHLYDEIPVQLDVMHSRLNTIDLALSLHGKDTRAIIFQVANSSLKTVQKKLQIGK